METSQATQQSPPPVLVPDASTTGEQSQDDPPWAVGALAPPDEGPPPFPSKADAVLVIRVGEPLSRARGGWKSDVTFDIGEGYAVFKEKCIAKFAALTTGPDASKNPVQLPEDASVYLRRAKNDTQAKFIQLTPANFVQTLQHRWRLLTTDDIRQLGDFRFEAFLYVQRAAQPEQFHRATARRVDQARMQRMAYETANAVQFGAITSHHLDVVHARRPESAVFEVPEDNTTAQTMELERQREALDRLDNTEEEAQPTATIQVKFNGLWMPLEVNVLSLRRALGLPDHDIFARGIFHEFTPAQPTNGQMNDEDHAEDESMV